MKAAMVILSVLFAMGAMVAPAQTNSSCFPHCHQCEVIAADMTAKRMLKKVEFSPLTGEEELTNKAFGIPGTSLMVIASVFYTDESMASRAGLDSMKLALTVSESSLPDAFQSPNNAITEVTLATFDTARVQTSVHDGARRLLVSMECKDTSSK